METLEIRTLFAGREETIVDLALRLREGLREWAPDLKEGAGQRPPMLTYGHSDRMRDLVFVIIPHSKHVNLQFADGSALPDPGGLMEGTGKNIRHVKVRSEGDIERRELKALVEAQLRARPQPD